MRVSLNAVLHAPALVPTVRVERRDVEQVRYIKGADGEREPRQRRPRKTVPPADHIRVADASFDGLTATLTEIELARLPVDTGVTPAVSRKPSPYVED